MTPFDGPASLSLVAGPSSKRSRAKVILPKPLSRAAAAKRLGVVLSRTWYQDDDVELSRIGCVLAVIWDALENDGLAEKGFVDLLSRAETHALGRGLRLPPTSLRQAYSHAVDCVEDQLRDGWTASQLAELLRDSPGPNPTSRDISAWSAAVQVDHAVEAAELELDPEAWLDGLRRSPEAAKSPIDVVELALEVSGFTPARFDKLHEAVRKHRSRNAERSE